MKIVLRVILTFVCFVGALLFSNVLFLALPDLVRILAALVAAAVVAGFVWTSTGASQRGLFTAMAIGALATGAIGFVAGFVGPMILTPEANQGPLLGIFITGPLGFILGAIGGVIYWLVWSSRVKQTIPWHPA